MLSTEALKLIALGEGRVDDLFWVRMDGAEQSCNPDSFMQTFPHLTCVVVDDSATPFAFSKTADIAAERIGAADVCLVDSWELYAFTRKEDVFQETLTVAKRCLPDAR